jgi:hypothetical protein
MYAHICLRPAVKHGQPAALGDRLKPHKLQHAHLPHTQPVRCCADVLSARSPRHQLCDAIQWQAGSAAMQTNAGVHLLSCQHVQLRTFAHCRCLTSRAAVHGMVTRMQPTAGTWGALTPTPTTWRLSCGTCLCHCAGGWLVGTRTCSEHTHTRRQQAPVHAWAGAVWPVHSCMYAMRSAATNRDAAHGHQFRLRWQRSRT